MSNPNWVKGMPSPNPAGRSPKVRELAYLAIVHEIVNANVWRDIVTQAVLDARGMKVVIASDGTRKMMADDDSNPGGRDKARIWLRDTLIGKPPQSLRLGDIEEDPFEHYQKYSDEQLRAIVAAADAIIESDSSGGGMGESGTESPKE